MKNNLLLFMICFCVSFVYGQSPITLGNNNMPGNGDTLRYTNVLPASIGNYTQTGANFTWNFSNLVSTNQGIRDFKSGLLTPYAFLFLSFSEYGEKLADTLGFGPLIATNYYSFYKKSTTPNAFIADGQGITFSNIPIPSYYTDKDELYNFPMSYPKYDSTTFRFSTPTVSLIPIVYSKTGYRITVVDGWGNITTPYGTDNCLRLITTQYSMDSIKTKIGSFSLPSLGFPNVVRSYQWFTSTSKIPYLEVTGNLIAGLFIPTQVRYRGYPQQATAIEQIADADENLSLYPNPVKDKLWLKSGNNSPVLIEINDMQGRIVKRTQLDLPIGDRYLDVSDLCPGVYLLKTVQVGEIRYLRFIKS